MSMARGETDTTNAFFSRALSTSRYKVLDLIMKDDLLTFKRNFSLMHKSEGEGEREDKGLLSFLINPQIGLLLHLLTADQSEIKL